MSDEAQTGVMARLLYSATVSLDGYLAGPGGDMSWLAPFLGPNPVAEALVDDIGALLVGARTHHGDDPNRGTDREGAFGGAWHGPVVVLTHHPPAEPVPDTTFTADLEEAVRLAVAAANDVGGEASYVNVLGADIARQLLRAGRIDEILVFVVPLLLGDGVPLLADPEAGAAGGYRLERIHESSVEGGGTNLWFRVLRDGRGP